MKLLIFLACTITVVVSKPSTKYTDKWDNINVDEILTSQRLLRGYVDCLLEKGRCTPDGNELKSTLPDALETGCTKCTAKQKEGSDKVLKHLINKRPDLWKELAVKYDPDNKYQEKYKDSIEQAKKAQV